MKNKKIMLLRIVVAITLTLVMVFTAALSGFAAVTQAGVYTIYGTYNIGEGNVSGYMKDFKIAVSTLNYKDDASTSIFYQDKIFNWGYFNFYIHAGDIASHTSFKLTRNGSTYVNKSLSGNSGGYLYQGSLPDGKYVLTYVGEYWEGIFSKKTYTFTYRFVVDVTSPSVNLTAGGKAVSSGTYTNKDVVFSCSDSNPGRLYYMAPNTSAYASTTSTTKSVSANASNNGWWYFYAIDSAGNASETLKIYVDTVAPVGKATTSSGIALSNGAYTSSPIRYSATDSGGISYLQVLTPTSSTWENYTANTALSSIVGGYYFRAVDKAGNVSSTSSVYYDPTIPSGTIYGGADVVTSGGYTNAEYVKYIPSDSQSGVANAYVKKPGSTTYVSYNSGTELTDEGIYYFYCVDRAGSTSSIVNVTLDKTAPIGTVYGGASAKANGAYTNSSYIRYGGSDSLSGGVEYYVKKPGENSYVIYDGETLFSAEGMYSFYCVDKAGNRSDIVTITLDRTKPTGILYAGNSEVLSGSVTNVNSIRFVPADEACLGLTYVKRPDASNYEIYDTDMTFEAEGTYFFYTMDKAGNQSSTYTITVNRKTPDAQLYAKESKVGNGAYAI